MAAESATIVSIVLQVQPRYIAILKSVIESYDNLATIRTADPVRHHLKLWFSPEHQGDIEELLEELASTCPTRRIA